MNLLLSLKKLNFKYRGYVSRSEKLWFLFLPYSYWNQLKVIYHKYDYDFGFVNKNVELVIDGYQGSANSYAVKAFRFGQTRKVRLAHHMHAPAQIIKAISLNIPTVLTVRDPEGSVLSLTRRWPYISVEDALIGYINFYNVLLPYKENYVLSTFDQTTQRFDQVITEVNKKYETDFSLVDSKTTHALIYKSEESVKDFTRNLDKKREKAIELSSDSNIALLEEAKEIYNAICQGFGS